MLKEKLQLITCVKQFNQISLEELSSISVLGTKLESITSRYEGAPKSHKELSLWKKTMYELLPADVKSRVRILSITRRTPIRTTLETHLSAIQDRQNPPDIVRENLEALYALATPYACFEDFEPRQIMTQFNEKIALASPKDEKRTVFPILRAALPAALSFGATLRGFGCKRQFATCRVARPHVESYQELEYFVDSQLFYMPAKDIMDSHVYIIEPLIAAGGSVIVAGKLLKDYKPKSITVLSMCATSYGLIQVVRNLSHLGIDTNIFSIDIGYLDNKGFVRPGFGDIGDRLHGKEVPGMIRELEELIGTYRPRELMWYQPEIDAIFSAGKMKTPSSISPKLFPADIAQAGDYDAGPAQG
ncbi:MAG: uracil phosphoribosyltransferase [Nanoarchaeota archaeon]